MLTVIFEKWSWNDKTQLFAQVSGGDLIATEAKYHLKCLVKLRNQYKSHSRKFAQEAISEKMNESRVFWS